MTVPSGAPSGVTRRKPDQVGVITGVVFLDRRQPLARHVQLDVAQHFGGVAVVDAGDARDQEVLAPAAALSISNWRVPSSVSSGP